MSLCCTLPCGVALRVVKGRGTTPDTARPTARLSSPVTWSTTSACLSMTWRRCRLAAARCGSATRGFAVGCHCLASGVPSPLRSPSGRHAAGAGSHRRLLGIPGGGTSLGTQCPPVRDAVWLRHLGSAGGCGRRHRRRGREQQHPAPHAKQREVALTRWVVSACPVPLPRNEKGTPLVSQPRTWAAN